MEDRELLELAAKAAGLRPAKYVGGFGLLLNGSGAWWNPLTDDGDALRLAAHLKLSLLQHPDGMDVTVVFPPSVGCQPIAEQQTLGRAEGLRRAIVRAAAEIGSAMP